ncbi:MAG: hypothetical protein IJ316_05475 [Clostridia bacterium]|nr:hypothetical protein [Clostridia bacterium]
MKKITALFLIICMLLSVNVFADEADTAAKVYLFGDDWAKAWGDVLDGYFYDSSVFINLANNGELMSNMTKKAEYSAIKKGDIVLISYGILEKDRPGDKNTDFKKNLETITANLTKKGATVKFVSIVSTMRYNTLTGHMEETKNFYTETTRSWAKKNNLTYIDLARITAEKANSLGSNNAAKLYKAQMELTVNGNRMCAYEVFKNLLGEAALKGTLKLNLSQIHDVLPHERSKTVDLLFEETVSDRFCVYTKGGVDVKVNGEMISDGIWEGKAVDGKINVEFTYCEKIQVSPQFYFDAADAATTDIPFAGKTFPGIFDVKVKKSEPLKASVYLNDYLIASNLDMPGTQPVTEAAEHTFEGYYLAEGDFNVKVTGLTDKLDYIAFNEADAIRDARPRIFVGGDSTVCNYYPLVRTGNEADGTVMTGWAMLLENYVDADVVNLAASGYWASKWKDTSFNIIEKEGKKGDIFILQFGINDRYYSTIEEMTVSLGTMIDTAAAKGMIPILVSPQISAGYGWGEEANTGKSDGGDYQEFFNAVRDLANEKGCFYVDLTDLSSGWFSEIGREAVYKKYHLWDYENNKPGDMMHLSYKGADAMCRFFVHGLKKLSDSKACDKWGNSLEILKIW